MRLNKNTSKLIAVSYIRAVKKYCFIMASTFIVLGSSNSAYGQACHGGGGGGGAASSGASPVGAATTVDGYAGALCAIDQDTSRVSANFFSFLSTSWGANGQKGEPLGTGGKLPLVYDQNLFMETASDLPTLARRDLRVQYGDFGYLPLWRNNVIFGRIDARLRWDIKAVLSMSYGGETGQPGTNLTNGGLAITEATIAWLPGVTQGFSLKAGNIADVGTYCDIYNQSPLTNYVLTGIEAGYLKKYVPGTMWSISLTGGTTFQNVTIQDGLGVSIPINAPVPNSYLKSTRQRTYVYAKGNAVVLNRFALNGVAGFQSVPQDSNVNTYGQRTYTYNKSAGIHAGLVASYLGTMFAHNLAITYGAGDVILGWGSPDYVRYIDSVTLVSPEDNQRFSKDGSTLTNGMYWGRFGISRFQIGFGALVTKHNPAHASITEVNQNYPALSYDTTLRVIYTTTGTPLPDSLITIETQPYTNLKFALIPSVHVAGPLHAGIRYDNIRYLNPDAHTNSQEKLRSPSLQQETLVDISKYDPYSRSRYDLSGPSKWETEAVNAQIFSPFIALDFPQIGGINVMYSHGVYEKPILRQGSIGKQHSNFTINAYVNYMIRSKS